MSGSAWLVDIETSSYWHKTKEIWQVYHLASHFFVQSYISWMYLLLFDRQDQDFYYLGPYSHFPSAIPTVLSTPSITEQLTVPRTPTTDHTINLQTYCFPWQSVICSTSSCHPHSVLLSTIKRISFFKLSRPTALVIPVASHCAHISIWILSS